MSRGPSAYKTIATDELELELDVTNKSCTPDSPTPHLSGSRRIHCRHCRERLRQGVTNNLKLVPWRWICRRFCSHVSPLILVIVLLWIIVYVSGPAIFEDDALVCNPDGVFSITATSYSPWSSNGLFAINIGIVTSTFGTAKLIDIIWDVGIGRGGQACLAYVSYQVFTKALSRSMESTTVTYSTFRALTLQNDTISAAFLLAKDVCRVPGARAKFSMLCMISLTIFVLAMPTWVSAMTGYSVVFSPYVRDSDGNLIAAAKFSPTFYVIHDGARLGEPYYDEYPVAVSWGYFEPYLSDYRSAGGFLAGGSGLGGSTSFETTLYNCQVILPSDANSTDETLWLNSLQFGNATDDKCSLLWLVSWYTSVNGLLGLNNSESIFLFPNSTNATIEGGALNISSCFTLSKAAYDSTDVVAISQLPWYSSPYGPGWLNPVTNKYEFNDTQTATFSYSDSGTTYDLANFGHYGSCQQADSEDVEYQWGFSYMSLYFFLLAFLIWIISMYVLYLDSYLNSRLDAKGRSIGLERAVLDLSEAVHKGVDGQDVTFSSNNEIRQAVHRSRVTYDDLPLESLAPTRWTQFVGWCKKLWSEKYKKYY